MIRGMTEPVINVTKENNGRVIVKICNENSQENINYNILYRVIFRAFLLHNFYVQLNCIDLLFIVPFAATDQMHPHGMKKRDS